MLYPYGNGGRQRVEPSAVSSAVERQVFVTRRQQRSGRFGRRRAIKALINDRLNSSHSPADRNRLRPPVWQPTVAINSHPSAASTSL